MADPKEYRYLEAQIVDALKTVFDPEIPVNIYEIGLIYEVKVDEENNAYVKMTLTSPNCPVAESLPLEVKQKVAAIDGINEVTVVLTFDPPWSRDMMSDSALLELGLL